MASVNLAGVMLYYNTTFARNLKFWGFFRFFETNDSVNMRITERKVSEIRTHLPVLCYNISKSVWNPDTLAKLT